MNTNPGLDIRPAAMIVQTLLPVRSAVVAEANEERVDAKSVLELCCLHAACGTKIKFTAAGADAAHALHAVEHLFATQFRAPPPPGVQPGRREGKKHPGDFHMTTCRWQRTGGFQEKNDITEYCTIERQRWSALSPTRPKRLEDKPLHQICNRLRGAGAENKRD